MVAQGKKPEYRVEFWFLSVDMGGWCQLGWAFVKAQDRDHALAVCVQRAIRRGHQVNKDTLMSVVEEDGSGRVMPPKTPPGTGAPDTS